VSVEVGGEVSGENPEGPNPDGHVQHAVVAFVALSLDDSLHSGGSIGIVKDEEGAAEIARPGKQLAI
jgi:hypothetical protein